MLRYKNQSHDASRLNRCLVTCVISTHQNEVAGKTMHSAVQTKALSLLRETPRGKHFLSCHLFLMIKSIMFYI